MPGIHDFPLFLLSCIALNLTPGPDTLYILGRSIGQGRAQGLASALGICSGCVVHTFAAALGLSGLLAASASAFLLVKLIGAAYLIYLGLSMLLSRGAASFSATPVAGERHWLAAYRQGVLTNVLNPKVALFFLAFLPQFIAADSAHKSAAFVLLGLSFVATGTVWSLCLAWFAAPIGAWLRRSGGVAARLDRILGAVFVALGLRLALSR